ncbi:MAG: hypothetical protein SFY66_10720 [Oculatellaceae cyanobacterium bins.114]|nr:hypothetical protein [Oculatellaceae cyanobacterium bins.114]
MDYLIPDGFVEVEDFPTDFDSLDAEVDAVIAQLEEMTGVKITDNGDQSEIPKDWDQFWKEYKQFVSDRPYLTE